jgi:uncharacterized protein YoxC|tara:strand:+ start:305 stop:538 length:234 start_codon:yes stop_codon:yes gene_type:complete
MTTQPVSLKSVKDAILFVVAIITCIAGVIFWVQTASDEKIERIERDITTIQSDVKDLQRNTNEILRLVGRLEGKIGN